MPTIAIDMDASMRLLAIIIVLVLLVLLAAVSVSRRRGERIERKVDAIAMRLGIQDLMQQLDDEYGRRSSYASLIEHDFAKRE